MRWPPPYRRQSARPRYLDACNASLLQCSCRKRLPAGTAPQATAGSNQIVREPRRLSAAWEGGQFPVLRGGDLQPACLSQPVWRRNRGRLFRTGRPLFRKGQAFGFVPARTCQPEPTEAAIWAVQVRSLWPWCRPRAVILVQMLIWIYERGALLQGTRSLVAEMRSGLCTLDRFGTVNASRHPGQWHKIVPSWLGNVAGGRDDRLLDFVSAPICQLHRRASEHPVRRGMNCSAGSGLPARKPLDFPSGNRGTQA